MTNTDIVNMVTSTVTGIGPLTMGIVGIEAGVQIGGDRKAVGTGQIMTEEGYRLTTEVTSVTGNLFCLQRESCHHCPIVFVCINVLPSL